MTLRARVKLGPFVYERDNTYSGRRPSRRSNTAALITLGVILILVGSLAIWGAL